jgi:hypothetical protein
MNPYAELTCDDLDIIQRDIYNFLLDQTELGAEDYKNWQFVETKKLVTSSPHLAKFFLRHRLYVKNAAVTVLYDDLPLHLDAPPMIAKINIPIRNTQGWVNRWYDVSEKEIAQLPKTQNQFGSEQEDVSSLDADTLPVLAEVYDLDKPIVFHSRIPHSVIKLTATEFPRIVASFTFVNDPQHLLR